MDMSLAIFWIVCAVATSYVASSKGRDGTAWFFIGLFTGILGVGLAVCCNQKAKGKSEL